MVGKFVAMEVIEEEVPGDIRAPKLNIAYLEPRRQSETIEPHAAAHGTPRREGASIRSRLLICFPWRTNGTLWACRRVARRLRSCCRRSCGRIRASRILVHILVGALASAFCTYPQERRVPA